MSKLKTSVQRGKYFKFYDKLLTKKIVYNVGSLLPGYFIKMRYKSDHRTGPKESIYLVLQVGFENKVHVLDLDYIKPKIFDRIVQILTKTGEAIEKDFDKDKMVILDFKADKATLYNAIVGIDSSVRDGYRTLMMNKVTAMNLVSLNIALATDEGNLNKDEEALEEEKTTEEFIVSDKDSSVLNDLTSKLFKTVNGKSTTKEDGNIGEFLTIE